MLGTEAEASHHLGSTEEAGWGLCGGLSLGRTKVHTGGLLGGATRVGSNAAARGNGGLWQRTGGANGRKMKGKNDGLAFLRKTLIFTLCLLTVCNVTRRLSIRCYTVMKWTPWNISQIKALHASVSGQVLSHTARKTSTVTLPLQPRG